jgi:hypothetical protein
MWEVSLAYMHRMMGISLAYTHRMIRTSPVTTSGGRQHL